MKKLMITITLAALTMMAHAQQFSIGARAGLNMTNAEGVWRYDGNKSLTSLYAPGFNVGVVGNLVFGKTDFSANFGLLFAQTRVRALDNWKADKYAYRYRAHINQLQVPINLQYNLFGTGLFMQAGPYLGFNLGGKWKTDEVDGNGKETNRDGDIKFGSDPLKHDSKAFDFGVGLGLGIQANSARIAFTYNLGIANLYNGDDDKTKHRNRGLMVTLTYLF
ncbi:MAG: PorT family protein [Bacteroidales bacterium]|jgi:hypothetical protein|nr:PorT family protein [Bacteroidales bacterium]